MDTRQGIQPADFHDHERIAPHSDKKPPPGTKSSPSCDTGEVVCGLNPVDDMDREELREALRNRRNRLSIAAAELAAERERLLAKGYIGPLSAAIMRRGVLHIETEVRWHDELDAQLSGEDAGLPGPAPAGECGPAARQDEAFEFNRDITR
jgi:hypothetical protein